MKEGKWFGINVCKTCDTELSSSEERYSEGVCPHCGHVTPGKIFCETYKVVIKRFDNSSWWEFWNKKYTYKGKDVVSENWLKKHNYKISHR